MSDYPVVSGSTHALACDSKKKSIRRIETSPQLIMEILCLGPAVEERPQTHTRHACRTHNKRARVLSDDPLYRAFSLSLSLSSCRVAHQPSPRAQIIHSKQYCGHVLTAIRCDSPWNSDLLACSGCTFPFASNTDSGIGAERHCAAFPSDFHTFHGSSGRDATNAKFSVFDRFSKRTVVQYPRWYTSSTRHSSL